MPYLRLMKIIEVSIETGIMTLIILGIRYLLKDRLSAKASYALLLVILISLITPHIPLAKLSLHPSIGVDFTQINTYIFKSQANPDQLIITPPPPTLVQDLTQRRFNNGLEVIYYIWLMGIIICTLFFLYTHYTLYYFCYKHARAQHDYKIDALLKDICEELHLKKHPTVLLLTPNFTPALFGILSPKILLPNNYKELFTYDELKLIFYHECYHLKRGDLYINTLFNMLQILHWFNPILWLAIKHVREERELSCDEDVLGRINLKEKVNYGNLLLHLYQLNSVFEKKTPSLVSLGGRPKLIKRRILNVKNENGKKLRPLLIIALMACLALFATAFAKDNKDFTKVKIDNIDLPFVDDSEVLGNWISVDFVKTKDQFNPDENFWQEEDLYLTNLNFLPNGELKLIDNIDRPWFKWTKGIVIHLGNETASAYEIVEIDNVRYMFFEWKSGDYTIRGMDPCYYVLKEDLN